MGVFIILLTFTVLFFGCFIYNWNKLSEATGGFLVLFVCSLIPLVLYIIPVIDTNTNQYFTDFQDKYDDCRQNIIIYENTDPNILEFKFIRKMYDDVDYINSRIEDNKKYNNFWIGWLYNERISKVQPLEIPKKTK